jgi:hypothetical protein
MSDERKVKESPRYQGVDEEIAYVIDTTPWGGYDSGATCVIKNGSGDDVSETHLSGSVSVNGDEITTPKVKSLAADVKYRVELSWVKSANKLECYWDLIGEE